MNFSLEFIILIIFYNININSILSLQLYKRLLFNSKLHSSNNIVNNKALNDEVKLSFISSLEKEQQQKKHSYNIINENILKINLKDVKKMWFESRSPIDNGIEPSLNDLVDFIAIKYEGSFVELIDDEKTKTISKNDTIYISESELIRLWNDPANKQFTKQFKDFDVQNALLLLTDDEDIDSYNNDSGINQLPSNILIETNSKYSEIISNDITIEDTTKFDENNAIIDEEEYYITESELRKLWDEQSGIRWGLPADKYDEKLALLLLCDDDESDFEYGSDYGKNGFVLASSLSDQINQPLKGFWEGISNPDLRQAVKRIVDDIDDVRTNRKAWKKGKNILTPDIDTQDFMGNIMFGNTYLTTRIPANWNDPENAEMSEIYRSTGSMDYPGEIPTDYTQNIPIYEILDLPFGPKYETKQKTQMIKEILIEKKPESIDWENFDFNILETKDNKDTVLSNVPIDKPKEVLKSLSNIQSNEDSDIEYFFKTLGNNNEMIKNPFDMDEVEPEEPEGEVELIPGKTPPIPIESSYCRDWITPREWIERSEFKDFVGYNEWSKYPTYDDEIKNDDIYMYKTIEFMKNITSYYLRDHVQISKANDDAKYINKFIESKMTYNDNYDFNDSIPIYLTPDKDRGIEYTNTILEMKSKLILEPKQLDPKIEYANDTFVYNDDKAPGNIIGTIREQYDWSVSDQNNWLIEHEKLEKIEPILKFVNYLGNLKSTKDNILIFEYKGILRHIVGLRETIKTYAKEVYPELVDLRLESPYKNDKFDI